MMSKYTNLELSLKLKKAGYDESSHYWFDKDRQLQCTVKAVKNLPPTEFGSLDDDVLCTSQPLVDVMDWLQEKRSVWIDFESILSLRKCSYKWVLNWRTKERVYRVKSEEIFSDKNKCLENAIDKALSL